ncbi:MAG: VWA domain-containing protein [Kiritimatiellae bacterium]|nr:VWA domain-containing protein [Kiritimatiellia bacterium]
MTKERREEAVLVAVAASVAIHVALMLLVRPHVMTHVVTDATRHVRHPPMRVVKAEQRPDPVGIGALEDLQAAKDAPVAAVAVPVAEAVADGPVRAPDAPAPSAVDDTVPPPPKAPVFDVSPVKTGGKDAAGGVAVPITRIETPEAAAAADSAPTFSVEVPKTVVREAPPPPSVPPAVAASDPVEALGPAKIMREEASRAAPPPSFTPAAEVYEKVDEQVVAAEKKAVSALVAAEDAKELSKAVNAVMTATAKDGWTYFRVMLSPRASLSVVPKDFVVLIDASGSIGKDRMASIRGAARRILRSAANSDDRFNLVAFRDRFSYAFRQWQECTKSSFDAADRWIDNLAAHGRTDVFSTISSVLTLPRDPTRPLIALVVTDGEANEGVSDTGEILSKFTALNDGLISVYMYGVKTSANRALIDVLTRGNRGESLIFDGWQRRRAGSGIEGLTERFRDPVLTDLRIVFASGTRAEAYPRLLRNLYRGGTLAFVGRVPSGTKEVAFSLKGLNGKDAYEGFFKLPLGTAPADPSVAAAWNEELSIDKRLGSHAK